MDYVERGATETVLRFSHGGISVLKKGIYEPRNLRKLFHMTQGWDSEDEQSFQENGSSMLFHMMRSAVLTAIPGWYLLDPNINLMNLPAIRQKSLWV